MRATNRASERKNNEQGKPDADAPVPEAGTEQAADQATKQQPPPEDEPAVMDTVASVADGVTDVADIAGTIFDAFG
jgi:hypothetical protein